MSNRREIEPSLDYYELRRRHEEYKSNQKQMEQSEAKDDAGVGAGEQARPEAARVLPAEDAVDAVAPAEDVAVGSETLALDDSLDEAGDITDEDIVDDLPEDDDAAGDNPNPFDSFIHAFRGIRGKLSGRFGRRGQADEELVDDAFDDEVPEDDAEPAAASAVEAVAPEPVADDAPQADASVEDVLDDAPSARRNERDNADAPQDEDFDDGDDGYEMDDDQPEEISGFRKFLRLFIVPVDEDEDAEDDAPEDDGYDDDADGDWESQADAGDEEGGGTDWTGPAPAADDNEGGPDMSDLNNVNSELTNALAADLEGSGMSRRERRELALRQAAEKAAAEAAAQAEAEAAQKAGAAADAAEEVVQKALEADAIEDVSSGIVNIGSEKGEYDAVTDEPTKEYKAVSKANLDDLMEDKDLEAEGGDDEEEEKPVRRGLFGRRRKAKDEEDEEDDYDDEDEDEDEDEAPRRGLFGRRRKAKDDDDYDDEEDEDEDEDEDDRRGRKSRRGRRYDEDDDDYDDDYDDEDDYDDDDYDDYDDDDEGTSFGHVLLGILKGFLTAVMLLLFVVVVLNVLNIFNVISLDGFASRLPTRMVSLFLPSQGMKQRINIEANTNAAPVADGQPLMPAAVEAPAEPAQPEPEPVAEAPIEEAPIEEAPVEEEPVEEEPIEEAPAEEAGGEAVG